MKVIIAAAGTAGHINPGLAIANKIMEQEPSSETDFPENLPFLKWITKMFLF